MTYTSLAAEDGSVLDFSLNYAWGHGVPPRKPPTLQKLYFSPAGAVHCEAAFGHLPVNMSYGVTYAFHCFRSNTSVALVVTVATDRGPFQMALPESLKVPDTLQLKNRIVELEKSRSVVGMISLWSGKASKVPLGWSLCDGSNGTPDLRGRFVRACQPYEGGDCDMHAKGDRATHTMPAGKHAHKGHTRSHQLTVDQIPAHHHGGGTHGSQNSQCGDAHIIGQFLSYGGYETCEAGGDEPHHHDIFLESDHQHEFDSTPQFYSLAYIMYIGHKGHAKAPMDLFSPHGHDRAG